MYIHTLCNVVDIRHLSNGFDDLLSNELITPELTIADKGRQIILFTEGSYTDAHLDVYVANSLGHHLPDRLFSGTLLQGYKRVGTNLLRFRMRIPNSVATVFTEPILNKLLVFNTVVFR